MTAGVLQHFIDGPRTTPEERAQLALPLAVPGHPTEADKGNDVTFSVQRGNDPDYLTARVARDSPDILERIKAGEFKSVRAAAREAGLVTPTCTVPLDPQRACLMG